MEDQASSPSCDLAAPPTPYPLSPVSKVDRRLHSFKTEKDKQLADGRGGDGEEPNHKAWSSLNHSIFSGIHYLQRKRMQGKKVNKHT